MFKFFEGALGEILAPVSGSSNLLFLAIQHHKDEELRKLVSASEVVLDKAIENGHSSIHCACRFNNVFALDLIMSRGINVNFLDSSGNTPLHYAAKFGHHELCKSLVAKGAGPGLRNNVGQTPYDVSENHVVRQFLLPLQFQGERDNVAPEYKQNHQQVGVQGQHTSGSNFNGISSNSPTTVSSAQSSSSSPPPPYQTNDPAAYQMAGTPGQPPLSSYRPPAPLSSNSRIIQPDGFHTSASDPELQKKYGHTRNIVDIAPPPIFSTPSPGAGGTTVPPQQYSMYSQPTGQHSAGPPTISRYVAYDPYTPTASTLAPIPSAQTYQYSTPASQPAVQINTFQTPIMTNNTLTQLMGGIQNAPVQGSSSSYVAAVPDTTAFAPPHRETPLAPQTHIAPPVAVTPVAEGGGVASFFSPTVTPISAAVSATQVPAAVTQQSTDASGVDSLSDSFCEVEILDASSSSVL